VNSACMLYRQLRRFGGTRLSWRRMVQPKAAGSPSLRSRRVSKRGLRLADPRAVEREYASEDTFLARRLAAWARLDGPVVEDEVMAAVRAKAPGHVLDGGCGTGDFTERVACELEVELVALDLSPRMVELTQARGIDARVGDLQALPFPAASFDCVIANRASTTSLTSTTD
jgi:SAM-dependent methyltransferase